MIVVCRLLTATVQFEFKIEIICADKMIIVSNPITRSCGQPFLTGTYSSASINANGPQTGILFVVLLWETCAWPCRSDDRCTYFLEHSALSRPITYIVLHMNEFLLFCVLESVLMMPKAKRAKASQPKLKSMSLFYNKVCELVSLLGDLVDVQALTDTDILQVLVLS